MVGKFFFSPHALEYCFQLRFHCTAQAMNSLRILGIASRRLLHGSARLNSSVPGTGAVGAAKGGKGDREETVAIPANRVLNYPSAEPYLHLRKGRKNIICINEAEVIAAKRKVPWHFKTGYSARTGRWSPPKYRGRARRNLRKRTRMAGKVRSLFEKRF